LFSPAKKGGPAVGKSAQKPDTVFGAKGKNCKKRQKGSSSRPTQKVKKKNSIVKSQGSSVLEVRPCKKKKEESLKHKKNNERNGVKSRRKRRFKNKMKRSCSMRGGEKKAIHRGFGVGVAGVEKQKAKRRTLLSTKTKQGMEQRSWKTIGEVGS